MNWHANNVTLYQARIVFRGRHGLAVESGMVRAS